jgi:hypothetical protein
VALVIGALLAFAVGLFGTGLGLDRDRAFYPVVTIVIASYYALFAVMGDSTHALVLESLVGAVFLSVAVSGFRSSLAPPSSPMEASVLGRVRLVRIGSDGIPQIVRLDNVVKG